MGQRTTRPGVEGSGNDKTTNSKSQQAGSGLGDCDVEVLFDTIDASKEKAHPHDKE